MKYNYREILTKTNVADFIVDAMRKSNRTGNEYGFTLIEDSDGKLKMTPLIEGERTSIALPISDDTIATFHTHPNEKYESLFSITDIKSMFESKVAFSVAIFDENGVVVADVFDTEYESFGEAVKNIAPNTTSKLELMKKLNEEIHVEKLEIGNK